MFIGQIHKKKRVRESTPNAFSSVLAQSSEFLAKVSKFFVLPHTKMQNLEGKQKELQIVFLF